MLDIILGYNKFVGYSQLKYKTMFEVMVGSGANIFITIVACLIGFVAAANILDVQKSNKKESGEE